MTLVVENPGAGGKSARSSGSRQVAATRGEWTALNALKNFIFNGSPKRKKRGEDVEGPLDVNNWKLTGDVGPNRREGGVGCCVCWTSSIKILAVDLG